MASKGKRRPIEVSCTVNTLYISKQVVLLALVPTTRSTLQLHHINTKVVNAQVKFYHSF